MINATRLVGPVTTQKAILFYNNIGRRTISVFSFRQKPEKSNESDTMENQQQERQPDVTAHSFGEGYATRSDEDGFGGTNALDENDAANKIQQDKMIHENHPVYDKTQGSEVAEKEKGRHQKSSS